MEFVKQGVLAGRELDHIVHEMTLCKDKVVDAEVYNNKTSSLDVSTRISSVYFTKPTESSYTHTILQSLVIQSYANDPFPMTYSNISEAQFVRYETGGFFKWHSDVISPGDRQDALYRTLTFSMNVNAGYTGGDLEVLHGKNAIKLGREVGSYIIFPSFLYHQAHVVSSGYREAIVVWIREPKSILATFQKQYASQHGQITKPESF
mgnify:CR=1 FL=1